MIPKRWFDVLFVLVLVLAFAACGDDDGDGGETKEDETSEDDGGGGGDGGGAACSQGAEAEAEIGELFPTLVGAQQTGKQDILAVLQFSDDADVDEFVNTTTETAATGNFPTATARTDAVELLDEESASVDYTLLIGEQQSPIPQEGGSALCVDGEWKVSLDAFCNLSAALTPCPPELQDKGFEGLTPALQDALAAE